MENREMIKWTNNSAAGLLTEFFDENDPRSAREQLDANYIHGGGVRPFTGFDVVMPNGVPSLHYPGDPALNVISQAKMRDESLYLFPYSWVLIMHGDKVVVVTRCD